MSQEQPFIKIKNLSKRFDRVQVLDDITFEVPAGKIVSIIGPNACGKTTLLNILSRIYSHDNGQIEINGKSLESLKVGYVIQNSYEALFPWKKTWDQITYPLELQKVEENERKKRASKLISELGLEKILSDLTQYPNTMSGGQRQACNIARAIMFNPDLLLLDEVFSQLDYETRLFLEDRILDIQSRLGIATICVSHDVDNAIYMSDFIAILSRKPSKILQYIKNPLPRPRNRAMFESTEFFEIRNKILDLFNKEVFTK